MVIREMQAQDVEAVTALEAACFTQPWKRHDFEDILTNPDRFYFVAVEDNEGYGRLYADGHCRRRRRFQCGST